MDNRVELLSSMKDKMIPDEFVYNIINDADFDISELILPPDKRGWTNCVYVLSHYPKEVLIEYLQDLLVWLQDMNWPGAFEICDLLSDYTSEELKIPLEKVLLKAKSTNDLCWGYWIKLFIKEYGYHFEYSREINHFLASLNDESC